MAFKSKPMDLLSRSMYRLKAGRLRVRSWQQSPLLMKITGIYRNTRIGQLSQRVSDGAHFGWGNYTDWILMKLRIYHIRRKLLLFSATFGAFYLGYFASSYGTNLYTCGYRQGIVQPQDYSLSII